MCYLINKQSSQVPSSRVPFFKGWVELVGDDVDDDDTAFCPSTCIIQSILSVVFVLFLATQATTLLPTAGDCGGGWVTANYKYKHRRVLKSVNGDGDHHIIIIAATSITTIYHYYQFCCNSIRLKRGRSCNKVKIGMIWCSML